MNRCLVILLPSLLAACAAGNNSPSADKSGLTGDGDTADTTATGLKAGTWTWTCSDSGNPNYALTMTHTGKTIVDETMAGYHVIADSKVQAPGDVGGEVGNVTASEITFLDDQELRFSLKVQDYSDFYSWLIYLQQDVGDNAAFFGAILSTYQSSDGDDALHPSSVLLTCTTTQTKT